jgi:hypothetical protein
MPTRRAQGLSRSSSCVSLSPDVCPTGEGTLPLCGVSVEVAGHLLCTVGDNPHRLHSEAAFAHLRGVAPVPASSGKTQLATRWDKATPLRGRLRRAFSIG